MTIIKAGKTKADSASDKVYTPPEIAKQLVKWLKLDISKNESFLEPCYGTGSFYNALCEEGVKNLDFCEIDFGLDFFDYDKKVNWIITNPPYSCYDAFLQHCFELADNVVFLIPLSKLVSSMGRLRTYKKYGGVEKMYILSASKCGFPFGFPCVFVYFKKGYSGHLVVDGDI